MADYLAGYEARSRYNPADASYEYSDPYAGRRDQEAFEKAFADTQTGRTKWREDLEAVRAHNRGLTGYRAPPRNPYAGYRYEDTNALVDLIGRRNVGVKFNPTLNSATTAAMWLQKQRENAKTKEEQEKWARWRVEQEDRDHDEYTPDNVVVYSDYLNNRVKAIDGFSLVPRNKKEALRARYDMFPDREERTANLQGPSRKTLKAYFRKFPNPETWDSHPFDKFAETLKESRFNIVKKIIEPMFKKSGFTIYSPKKTGNAGTLLITQYMTILQRITSWVMATIYSTLSADVPQTYDWVHDPQKFKNKSRLRRIEEDLKAQANPQIVERLQKVIPTAKAPATAKTVYDYILDTALAFLFISDGRGANGSFVLQFISDLNAEYVEQIVIVNATKGTDGVIHYTLNNDALNNKKAAAAELAAMSADDITARQAGLRKTPSRGAVRTIRSKLGWPAYPTEMSGIERLTSEDFGGSSGSSSSSSSSPKKRMKTKDTSKRTSSLLGLGAFEPDPTKRTKSRAEKMDVSTREEDDGGEV
jgi:hypothetical protein